MPASKRLRTVARGNPVPGVTGVLEAARGGQDQAKPNYGSADVRGNLLTRVITLQSFGGTDSFTIRVRFRNPNRAALTPFDAVSNHDGYTDTASIVRGTNAGAANVQSELRTATGDSSLTVTGTDDEGPFTVTQGTSDKHRDDYELQLVSLSGCSGTVTSGPVTYVDATGHVQAGTAGDGTLYPAANVTPSSPGRLPGEDVPLGYSVVTDGVGQTAQTTLVPVVIDEAVGGNDEVVIAGTEDASGGTGGNVIYSIFKTADDVPHSTVLTEDADADVTITGLDSATDYYVIGCTVTANTDFGSEAGLTERVSRPTAPVYFTTT